MGWYFGRKSNIDDVLQRQSDAVERSRLTRQLAQEHLHVITILRFELHIDISEQILVIKNVCSNEFTAHGCSISPNFKAILKIIVGFFEVTIMFSNHNYIRF